MKRLLPIACLAATTGCASLPREQLAYEVAYQTLHAVDTAQTLNIRHTAGHVETNPILGKRPKDAEVIAYMAAESAAHLLVSTALVDRGAPMWLQRLWHYVSIGYNGRIVISNARQGL